MIFIYAEKATHSHERLSIHTSQEGVAAISNSTGCTICDFTIAKDAVLPIPELVVTPSVTLRENFIALQPSYYYSPIENLSSRGPPAI